MKKTFFFLIMVMCGECLISTNAFANFTGRADLSYQTSRSVSQGKTTRSSSVSQLYSLGLNRSLTSTITLSGELRYTIRETRGETIREFSPLLFLNFSPPSMYNLSFTYNRSETAPDEEWISTSNTNISFHIPQRDEYSFSTTYTRSTTIDHLTPHEINMVTSSFHTDTGYSLDLFGADSLLTYTFTTSISEDKVGNIKTQSPKHSISMDISKTFWDDKIDAGANMGYEWSKTTSRSLGAPTRFEQSVELEQGLFLEDTTPTFDFLVDTPDLKDNNTGASAGIDLNGSFRNIGFKFTGSRAIHKIYLYIDTSDTNIGSYDFGWELYSSGDGVNWSLVATPSTAYESAFSRLVFTFTELSATYFKIVNTTFPAGALSIDVTEIKAIGFIQASPTQSLININKRDFGAFNIVYMPIKRLRMSYGINYDHSSINIGSVETITLNQNVNTSYKVIPRYLDLLVSYGRSYSSSSGEETSLFSATSAESIRSNYSVTLSSAPLQTLTGNINYGHSEAIEDGTKGTTTNSISGNLSMNLYKGVDLSIGSSMSRSRNPVSDTRTRSHSYTGNLRLVPWRPLTILLKGSITSGSTVDKGVRSTSRDNSLSSTISYSPTRKLYASANLSFTPSRSMAYSISWLITDKIQTNMRYGITEDQLNMGFGFSWNPGRGWSMSLNYNGSRQKGSSDRNDSIDMRVSVTF